MAKLAADAGLATRAIHADRDDNTTHAVVSPIYQSSTFRWDSPEHGLALAQSTAPTEFYSRWGNPNTRQLETLVASLEGGERALAVASGMAAACLAVLPHVRAGDHVVGARTLYGEVNALITTVLPRFGVEGSLVASTDPADYAAAMRPNTRVVVTETPANPTLDCVDLRAVAAIARARGARLVVDNTFATPFNTRPLALGAHAVYHSATKYLGGHSDVVAGVLVSDREAIERAWEMARVFGPVLGPFEAWLVARGLRTFALRMARHNANADRVARALAAHPAVASVSYPGLAEHPTHRVAAAQMSGFGAMVSVVLRGEETAARRFVADLRLFVLATSLGGVESLVMYPASLSGLTAAQQREAGIEPGLIRLSVGCEDAEDLLADLDRALGR